MCTHALKNLALVAILITGLAACESTRYTEEETDKGISANHFVTYPFHMFALADRDILTSFFCKLNKQRCEQELDKSQDTAEWTKNPFSFKAYYIGEKVTLPDGQTHQHFETWEKPVEMLGMKMPMAFGALCEQDEGPCLMTIPNKDEGTFLTIQTFVVTVIIIWINPLSGGGGATIEGSPAAAGGGGPIGPF